MKTRSERAYSNIKPVIFRRELLHGLPLVLQNPGYETQSQQSAINGYEPGIIMKLEDEVHQQPPLANRVCLGG